MVKIKITAKTTNAMQGLTNHFSECNRFLNKMQLKAHGVTQTLNKENNTLEIEYSNLLTKIQDKLKTTSDFKAIIKEEQKNDFIKHVNSFMEEQKVSKEEYEVSFL